MVNMDALDRWVLTCILRQFQDYSGYFTFEFNGTCNTNIFLLELRELATSVYAYACYTKCDNLSTQKFMCVQGRASNKSKCKQWDCSCIVNYYDW